jgi:NAD(P)-dependent dehydrogenase (short-subunit alcohol dehydrogenase family)
MKVADKVVVVTGAGNGIGRELALQLVRRGARVAGVDVDGAALGDTARAAADGVVVGFAGSVADKGFVASLPAQVLERMGAIDAVINCAGIIQPFVRLKDLDDAAIDRVFAVNFTGTLAMTRAFLPALLARPEGHIVNISSMGGFLPVPGQTIYGASKAAVKLLTEGLHAELRGTPVRVTVVFPGAIATNIAANSGVLATLPSQDAGKSKIKTMPVVDAARTILDGMEADAYRVLVGDDAKLMDALYRLDPARAAAFIARKMRGLLR